MTDKTSIHSSYSSRFSIGTVGFLAFLALAVTWAPTPTQALKPQLTPTKSPQVTTTTPCIALQPGRALGPIKLGMTESQVRALKLPFRYEGWRKTVAHAGPYRLVFRPTETNKTPVVDYITIDIKPKSAFSCLHYAGKKISLQRSLWSIAAQIGTCLAVELRIGGNVIQCHHKGMMLKYNPLAKGWAALDVGQLERTSVPSPICKGYILPGSRIALAQKEIQATPDAPATWNYRPNSNVCVRNTKLTEKLDYATLQRTFPGECSRERTATADVVYCNHAGLAFFFSKQTKRFLSVKLYHQKRLPLPSWERLKP